MHVGSRKKGYYIGAQGLYRPHAAACQRLLGNALPVTGYYVQEFAVADVTRTAKVYIPEGTPIRSYFTVISVPDGWNTEDFLVKSGWKEVADERKEGLFVLEPDPQTGKWGTVLEETVYIKAALAQLEARKFYSTHGVHYIAGYGSGGTALQNYVANQPLHVISAVFINTQDLDNLDAIGVQEFVFTPRSTPAGLDPRFTSIPYNEIPVPVWFVNKDASAVANLIEYWKYANDVEVSKERPNGKKGGFGEVYYQKADSDRLPTSYSDVLSQVAVLEKDIKYDNKNFTRQVYEFLSYYTRYDNTTAFGNVLGVRPDYKKLKVDINNMTVVEPDGKVWNWEYIVYVPKNAHKIFPDGAPVVYVFAGGSQPNRLFFDATHWWEVADRYGFIVCVPCSQYSAGNNPLETRWNYNNTNLDVMADDFEFLKLLIAEVDSKYNTDPNRRFATGQSNGSMFCHGIGYRMPEYFTAIGSTSATRPHTDGGGSTSVLPFFLIYGENDSSYDIFSPGSLRNVVTYWLERNGLGNVLDTPSEIRTGVGPLERLIVYSWENQQGIPLYMYGVTAGREHNCTVDNMWSLWEEWFSKWDKDDAGNLYYEGQLVQK